MRELLTISGCALVGWALGPLVTLLIGRPPLMSEPRESLRLPFRCASCRAAIASADAVPLVGFLRRRGRCAACAGPIPRWEIAAELITIAVCALVGWRVSWHGDLPAHLLLGVTVVIVVFIDGQRHLIPTRIVYPATAMGVALLALAAVAEGDGSSLLRALGGALAASAFLWVTVLISPRGMGQGDARLVLLLGLFLGWHGWVHVYMGLLLGFVVGALGGVLLMIRGRGGRKTQIAFGPYLAAAGLFTVLWPELFI